jgi:hypothetical protein
LDQLPANEWPSKESLMDFHNDVSLAITKLQNANKDVQLPAVCGSALQLMLNFPHSWMVQSGTHGRFVEAMTDQAREFVELKAKADASLG